MKIKYNIIMCQSEVLHQVFSSVFHLRHQYQSKCFPRSAWFVIFIK